MNSSLCKVLVSLITTKSRICFLEILVSVLASSRLYKHSHSLWLLAVIRRFYSIRKNRRE